MEYLILQHPGHNRVYYKSAGKLALAELELACRRLSSPCTDIEMIKVENIPYLSLRIESEISEEDLLMISKLSFVFAIYKREKLEDRNILIPIKKSEYEYLDSKISSLLKYQGKTNELFTKMMINVGLLSSDFAYDEKIQMLDPVAGKGTTLYEGAVYGYDVFGVEIEANSVHESIIFFKKYLEEERIKHRSEKRQIYGKSKSEAIIIHEFDYALSKEDFRDEGKVKKFGLVCGNTNDVNKYFKKNRFHLIVGDLPYGIVHGNTGTHKSSSATRNPSELLSDCLNEYYKVLKEGGVIVLAWNSFIVSRYQLTKLFMENGFQVLSEAPYDQFEHMVDKSIKRDIIVAKKTKPKS